MLFSPNSLNNLPSFYPFFYQNIQQWHNRDVLNVTHCRSVGSINTIIRVDVDM